MTWTPTAAGNANYSIWGNAVNRNGSSSGDTVNPVLVTGSKMVSLRPEGFACTAATQCASNSCVDGICCDSACDSACEECSTGQCTAIAAEPVAGPTTCCQLGFRWSGTQCVDIDECAAGTNTCFSGEPGTATCVNTTGGFTCECPEGFSGDGKEAGTQCAPNCGNGSLDEGEQCDAGGMNGVAGTCCSATCQNIPDCCTQDAQCADDNACTANTCNVATGACEAELLEGCCLTDAECAAPDQCSIATCEANTCVTAAIADCCLEDSECEDADPCTTNTCADAVCVSEPIEGCGMPDEDMGSMPDMGDMPDLGIVDQPDMDQADMGQPELGQDDTDEGCGCASANAPSNGILVLLLLAFFIRRRL